MDIEIAAHRADDRAGNWAARVAAGASAASALAEGIARLHATAGDDEVAVTVDATGALIDLRLGEGVRALSPERLTARILATLRTAQVDLLARVGSLLDTTVGGDSPAATGVLDALRRRARIA